MNGSLLDQYLRLLRSADDASQTGGSGGGDDGGEGGTGDDDGSGDDGGKGERTFTQAEVDKLVGKAKGTTKTAAKRDIAEALGMSVEDAAAILKERAEAQEAEMSDAEKLKAEADKLAREAAAAKAEARTAQLDAMARSALLSGDAPLQSDRMELALPLVLKEMDADTDDDAEALAEAVEWLREKSGEWFGSADDDDDTEGSRNRPPGNTGRNGAERKKGKKTAKTRAQEMLERNKPPTRSPMSERTSTGS